MQAQAQGQTNPITLALSPGADAASAAGILPVNDLYNIRMIFLRGSWKAGRRYVSL